MVGPDGAVAFFYGQGSNPARHRVNPSIQRRPTAWITARRWRARHSQKCSFIQIFAHVHAYCPKGQNKNFQVRLIRF